MHTLSYIRSDRPAALNSVGMSMFGTAFSRMAVKRSEELRQTPQGASNSFHCIRHQHRKNELASTFSVLRCNGRCRLTASRGPNHALYIGEKIRKGQIIPATKLFVFVCVPV
jgi:hypothetical protein